MRASLALGVLVLLALCQACVSTAGQGVLVTEDRELVRPCKLMRRVGISKMNRMSPTGDEVNRLRNETAEAGGNVLLQLSELKGEAFLCEEEQLANMREANPER